MSKLILIHGAWHSAWCWYKLTPLLEQAGHIVITPDLPGHTKKDIHSSPVSFADYIVCIRGIVEQQTDKVTLVGHSMAGIIISQLAEIMPKKISRLIYLTAFMPDDGQSLLEITKTDKDGLVLPNLDYSPDRKMGMVKEAVLQEAFYHDCSDEDIELAKANLVPQSLAPLDTPIHITEENWGSVPRSYIECTQDRAITLSTQRLMLQRHPCVITKSMNTSHSPFFSAPGQLAEHIDLICK